MVRSGSCGSNQTGGHDEDLRFATWVHSNEKCALVSDRRQHDEEFCRRTGMQHMTFEEKHRIIPQEEVPVEVEYGNFGIIGYGQQNL